MMLRWLTAAVVSLGLLAATASAETLPEAFTAAAAPTLSYSAGTLSWTPVSGATKYVVVADPVGKTEKPVRTYTAGTSAPAEVFPGKSVRYFVREWEPQRSSASNVIKITWESESEAERKELEETQREETEAAEREAREKAEREAKEKSEREAREKAELEQHEREAREKAEREKLEEPPHEEVPGATTYGGYSATNPMLVPPGSTTSAFNQTVAGAAVLSNSAEIVSFVRGLGSPMPGNATSGPAWKHPTVYASNSDPIVELRATEPWGTSPLTGRKVHAPAAWAAAPPKPSEGGDAHLEIVLAPVDAKASGETAEMWRANPPVGGVLKFAWGGPGNIAATGTSPIGATAAGLDLWAGQVRGAELKTGQINHALCLVIKSNKSGSFVAPANHTDGTSGSAAAPKEGQRFKLNYTATEIANLPVKPWKKAVLNALSKYGGYDCDSGGPGLAIEFEAATMFTAFGQPNPFATIGKEQGLPTFNSEYVFNFSEGLDWGRLQAVTGP